MKKLTSKKVGTVALSGFGAALSLLAGNLAQAETVARPAISKVTVAAQAVNLSSKVTYDKATLCKVKNASCLMSKPYVKKLSTAEKARLRVLIGLGVQTDIKDVCLVC